MIGYLRVCKKNKGEVRILAEDLMKALNNLEEMLKDIPQDQLIKPHLDESEIPAESPKAEAEESNYCIKNGAYVRVEDNCMKAWLYLNPPKKGEDFYSRDLIMSTSVKYWLQRDKKPFRANPDTTNSFLIP